MLSNWEVSSKNIFWNTSRSSQAQNPVCGFSQQVPSNNGWSVGSLRPASSLPWNSCGLCSRHLEIWCCRLMQVSQYFAVPIACSLNSMRSLFYVGFFLRSLVCTVVRQSAPVSSWPILTMDLAMEYATPTRIGN